MPMMIEPVEPVVRRERSATWAEIVVSLFGQQPITAKVSAARSQPYDEIAQAPAKDDE